MQWKSSPRARDCARATGGTTTMVMRLVAGAGLVAMAAINLVKTDATYNDPWYVVMLHLALMAADLAAAGALVRHETRRAWVAAALLATATIAFHLLHRRLAVLLKGPGYGNLLDPVSVTGIGVGGIVLVIALSKSARPHA